MNMDGITITVLDDGRVKIETDEISAPNHKSADEALKFLEELFGGEVIIVKRKAKHAHVVQQVRQSYTR
jgi:hypothetical protein